MSDEPSADHAAILADAAEHFYDAEELYEDEDLDPDDHVAVLVRAFTSGACDDFAHVVHLMTGWSTVRASWSSAGGVGHHTLVRDPDGRLFDASGWTDERSLRQRYVGRRRAAAFDLADALPLSSSIYGDEDLQRIASVIRSLPHAPFDAQSFRHLSARPVSNPDFPSEEEAVAAPSFR